MKINKPYLAWCIQFLAWPFIFIWSKFFFELEIIGQENTKGLSGPLIIAASHPSIPDSFIFRIALEPFTNLLPLRFLATYNFDSLFLRSLKRIGLIWFTYTIFAVIPIVRGKGLEIALARPKEILKNGGAIIIYPEGKQNLGKEPITFRQGAAALAIMSDSPILPVAIKMEERKFKKRKYIVSFGRPMKMPAGISYEEATTMLYSQIHDMYVKI